MIVLLSIATSDCGSPTSPSVPNVQGFYHGGYTVATCIGTGFPASQCDVYKSLPNGGLNLRLFQSDRALHAFISICGSEINDLTGTVETDGTITLSGQDAVQFYSPMVLSSFHATVSGTSMTGTFACTIGSPPNTQSLTGTLKDVTFISRNPNIDY